MRCRECNIDLGERYTKCPLCGSEASQDEVILTGIAQAPYPEYDRKLLQKKKNFKCDFPQKFVLRAAVILCIPLGLLSLYGHSILWTGIVPVLMSASAIFYYISGIIEKSRLLHSAVGLISTAAVLLGLVLISLIAGTRISGLLFSLAGSVLLLLLLFAIKPKNMRSQMKALFKL